MHDKHFEFTIAQCKCRIIQIQNSRMKQEGGQHLHKQYPDGSGDALDAIDERRDDSSDTEQVLCQCHGEYGKPMSMFELSCQFDARPCGLG